MQMDPPACGSSDGTATVRSCSLNVVRQVPDALAQALRDILPAICVQTASGSSAERADCLPVDALWRLGGILHRHREGS